MTKHSPLGASGAERWMNCPGSVTLLKKLTLPESDEPDYRREGTALHEAAAHCLINRLDAWEIIGQTFNDTVIDEAMGNAVQVYVNYVLPFMGDGWQHYVEYGISSPVHDDFYGTCDFGATGPDPTSSIRVVDLKGGEGIMVDAEDNPQLKYYAYGLIGGIERGESLLLPASTPVNLAIVQPRITWTDSPIREWETTVGAIKAWVHDELVPAMNATDIDDRLQAGDWCRFCPAKLACPLLTSLFRAAATHNPKDIVHLDNDSVGRSYQLAASVKHYIKALEDETFRRLNTGQDVLGTKLVNKKANRVWAAEAPKLAVERFGDEAMEPATIKGPAALEKVSPAAAAFVKEHAYTPSTGLTVALATDNRVGVKVPTLQEAFQKSVDTLVAPT